MKFIIPIVIVAVCVSAYFVYLGPAYSTVQEMIAQKNVYLDTLQKSKELKETRDAILTSYNSISESDIVKLKKILPDKTDDVTLAFSLSSMAGKYGLVFNHFKVTSGSKDKTNPSSQNTPASNNAIITSAASQPYAVTSVSFDLKGEYGQFVNFLKDLENNLQLMDITYIQVKQNQGNVNPNPVLDISVQMQTYSLK